MERKEKNFNIWGFVSVRLCRFESPLEMCDLLSLSQLLSVWKAEKESGCLAPGEQVDFGKDIDWTEVPLRSSPVSQEQLITRSKSEFSPEMEAGEGLKDEALKER